MSPARELVINRIAAQARKFPELEIAPLATAELDARDASLAAAIDHAVARRWLTLARVIESQLSRPWDQLENKVQATLLCGAAQLLLLERVPDHAAINESVEWAKSRVRTKAGGLVNAVLRKVAALRSERLHPQTQIGLTGSDRDVLPLNDGSAWRLTEPIFDPDPLRRLAQQTSHPEPLIAQWFTTVGQENASALAAHNLMHAPIIIHGLDSPATNAALQTHNEPGFFVLNTDHVSLREWLARHPDAIVQDPTSAAPVIAASRLSPGPRTIIDACAGRGTKTRQLAMLHPDAMVIASDIDPVRQVNLRDQFAGNVRINVVAYGVIRSFDAKADLLVLDVPCSNTGVLARRVEAKYRANAATMKKLVDLQRQIIADCLPLLAPRGRLLYCTCSIDAAENEQQAQWIAKWHPFRIAHSDCRLPSGLPGDPPAQYADGGYFAILERRGS